MRRRCFNPRAHAGRDPFLCQLFFPPFSFNPRAHAGRDKREIHRPTTRGVSIHAPTRGATRNPEQSLLLPLFQSTRPRGARPDYADSICSEVLFQSTRPRGARRRTTRDWKNPRGFQSTRPRGARPFSYNYFYNREGFNPRAHAGRDPGRSRRGILYAVSIHAPTRGATVV